MVHFRGRHRVRSARRRDIVSGPPPWPSSASIPAGRPSSTCWWTTRVCRKVVGDSAQGNRATFRTTCVNKPVGCHRDDPHRCETRCRTCCTCRSRRNRNPGTQGKSVHHPCVPAPRPQAPVTKKSGVLRRRGATGLALRQRWRRGNARLRRGIRAGPPARRRSGRIPPGPPVAADDRLAQAAGGPIPSRRHGRGGLRPPRLHRAPLWPPRLIQPSLTTRRHPRSRTAVASRAWVTARVSVPAPGCSASSMRTWQDIYTQRGPTFPAASRTFHRRCCCSVWIPPNPRSTT